MTHEHLVFNARYSFSTSQSDTHQRQYNRMDENARAQAHVPPKIDERLTLEACLHEIFAKYVVCNCGIVLEKTLCLLAMVPGGRSVIQLPWAFVCVPTKSNELHLFVFVSVFPFSFCACRLDFGPDFNVFTILGTQGITQVSLACRSALLTTQVRAEILYEQ